MANAMVTVWRPNGAIETVDTGKVAVPRWMYDKMVEQTRAAGRGEIIDCDKIVEPDGLTDRERETRRRRAAAASSYTAQIERAGDINTLLGGGVEAEHHSGQHGNPDMTPHHKQDQ